MFTLCSSVWRFANIYSAVPPILVLAPAPCAANWAKVVATSYGLCPFSPDFWSLNHGRNVS